MYECSFMPLRHVIHVLQTPTGRMQHTYGQLLFLVSQLAQIHEHFTRFTNNLL